MAAEVGRAVSEKGHSRPGVLIYGSFQPPGKPCGVTAAMRSSVESPLRNFYELEVITTHRSGTNRGVVSRLCFGLWLFGSSWIRMLRSGAAVVDVHAVSDRDFLKHAAVVLAAKLAGRRCVLRVHGGDFDRVYDRGSSLNKSIIRWILRLPDSVVLLSRHWAEVIARIERSANCCVIPNSICCDEFESIATRRQEGSRQVLLLGNLCERKGHFDALEATYVLRRRFPDVELLFAGAERDEGSLEALRAHADTLGLNGAVHFLGPVFGDAKDQLFADAGVFILPSHAENMPISIMEAMAVGLPVVASRVGAVPDMLEDGVTGLLIDPRDPDALAERIATLFENPEECARMGRRAQTSARDAWDQSIVAEKNATLYAGHP
ncbi:MAG: glycosyltransferase family 4 protein [bacterium]|nr:glycosyltransferase family 4 protein [bacterium]